MNIKEIIGDYDLFLDKILGLLESNNIDVSNFFLDHLCYRVQNKEDYSKTKSELLNLSTLISEANVGGRPIASLKLHECIIYKNRKIPLIELPYPRENKLEVSGLEHIEFVIDTDLDSFIKMYPHISFDTKGLNKADNADIKWSIEGITVKFHRESLEDVIERENNVNHSK